MKSVRRHLKITPLFMTSGYLRQTPRSNNRRELLDWLGRDGLLDSAKEEIINRCWLKIALRGDVLD